MPMTLYELAGRDDRRFSPHCWRIWLALAHKGLEASAHPLLFSGMDAIAGIGDGLVPVLDDDGHRIGDSWAIAEYLEDRYADRPSLFGDRANARPLAQFVHLWTSGGLQLALFPCLAKDIHDHVDPADRGYFRTSREQRLGCSLEEAQAGREAERASLEKTLLPLRALLKRQPWVGGEQPMYADYIVFSAFQWARMVSGWRFLGGDDDPIRAWRGRVGALFGGLADSVPYYPD